MEGFSRHADLLTAAWKRAIGQYRNSEVIWQEGFLHIPEGVSLVWPDNGHGLIQDGATLRFHTPLFQGERRRTVSTSPVSSSRSLG